MSGGIFNVENKFWQFLNKMTDLFLLSILAVLFSLPVITAGGAMCGFYYGAMRLYEDTDGGVWQDFWYGFRSGLRQATPIWLLQLAVMAVLALNLWISLHIQSMLAIALTALSLVMLAMVLIASFFAYPIAARYTFNRRKILRDALSTAVSFFPHGFALLVIAGVGVAAAVKFPYVAVFVPAVVGYQIARVNVWIFNKFQRNQEDKAGKNNDEQTSQ